MSDVTVWKFELTSVASCVIKMPKHARVLSTAFQDGLMMVWAAVVTSNEQVDREFFVALTGAGYDRGVQGPFIGTVFHKSGLVFHVFDLGEVQH